MDIPEKLRELEERIQKLEALTSSPDSVTHLKGKKCSEKEFLIERQSNDANDTDKALILGYFLESIGGMSCFNASDLKSAFHAAKEKTPKNMNDKVNKLIARGLLMEAEEKKDSKKAWVLTSSGEKLVEKLEKYSSTK